MKAGRMTGGGGGRAVAAARREAERIAAPLLAWYDRHARTLPWRVPPAARAAGQRPDPYLVWLSEIMLQQTTTVAAAPYFQRFVERWPSVEALAAAPLEEVLTVWAGLGYYARARNLHACARVVAGERGGRFPDGEAELRRLPGIGPYTAAAIAAIAFDRPAAVVDGNVERVLARLFAVEAPLPDAKPALRELAAETTPERRPGDYAQAVMDLGATVCLPRKPRCLLCPLGDRCAAHAQGRAADLPRRRAKAARPRRHGVIFWLARADGAVLVQRRPERGLLGGMMEFPSTPWRGAPWPPEEALAAAPAVVDWRALPGRVRHVFTHFELELEVWSGRAAGPGKVDPDKVDPGKGRRWVEPAALGGEALPSVMAKVATHVLERLATA